MENQLLVSVVEKAKYAKDNRRDFIVDARSMKAIPTESGIELEVTGLDERFGFTEWAHGQLADKLGIPKRYYDRIRSAGNYELLADNINAWIGEKEKRMIRTLDGKCRAILSSRYRCLDNYDLIFLALNELKQFNCEIKQSVLTETNLYLKAVTPELRAEVLPGDIVQAGIVISNSEVGAGALRVEPMIWRLVCENGLISSKVLREIHVGGDQGLGDIWSSETRARESETTWLKVRDLIRANFQGRFLDEFVEEARKASETKIGKPVEIIDGISDDFKLTDEQRNDIIKYFFREGDPSIWSLTNAITSTARDQERIDEQLKLEKLGYSVMIDLTKKKLKQENLDFSAGVEK